MERATAPPHQKVILLVLIPLIQYEMPTFTIYDSDASGIVVWDTVRTMRLVLSASPMNEHRVSVDRMTVKCDPVHSSQANQLWYMMPLDVPGTADLIDINVSIPPNISMYIIRDAPCIQWSNASSLLVVKRLSLSLSLSLPLPSSISLTNSSALSPSLTEVNQNLWIILGGIVIAALIYLVARMCSPPGLTLPQKGRGPHA